MKNNPIAGLTVQQLERAIDIKKQIAALEKELGGLSGVAPAAPVKTKAPAAPKKRALSPAVRAKIAAGQKATWAKRRLAAQKASAQKKNARR